MTEFKEHEHAPRNLIKSTSILDPGTALYKVELIDDLTPEEEKILARNVGALWMVEVPGEPCTTIAVFGVKEFAPERREVLANRIDPAFALVQVSEDAIQTRSLLNLYIRQMARISEALGHPYKDDQSKSVNDLVDLAVDRLTPVTVLRGGNESLLRTEFDKLRAVWDRTYKSNANLTDAEWGYGDGKANVVAAMSAEPHRFVHGGHSGEHLCRVCGCLAGSARHQRPERYDALQRLFATLTAQAPEDAPSTIR